MVQDAGEFEEQLLTAEGVSVSEPLELKIVTGKLVLLRIDGAAVGRLDPGMRELNAHRAGRIGSANHAIADSLIRAGHVSPGCFAEVRGLRRCRQGRKRRQKENRHCFDKSLHFFLLK